MSVRKDLKVVRPLNIPTDRPVRVLLSGVWDLFHYGHAKAMESAKKLFPQTILIIGIHSDKTVLRMKGKYVLSYDERKAMLSHIKWVDEIIDDAPWFPSLEYLEERKIDFVVGDEIAYSQYESEQFKPVRTAGKFISMPREEGISTASILTRVVRDYDSYVHQNLDRGRSMKDLNVSYLKAIEIAAKRQLSSFMSAMNPASQDKNVRVGGFVQAFGERVLHSWNILGTVKELVIRRQQDRSNSVYPAKDAPQHEVENLQELLPLALENCHKFVPGWQNIEAKDIKISVITGGLTNRLYKLSIPAELAASLSHADSAGESSQDIIPHQLLFRVYGAGTENFFNRENEHKIFKVFSDSGMGPKLYGIFEAGRIEEFLSLHSLEQQDLPKLAPLIAEKIATMHASEMPGLPQTPSLFDSLWTWIRTAEDISFPNNPKKQEILDSLQVKERLTKELSELQENLLALNSPVFFCHNDLLGGNIMYDEETQRLCFIDYEYGAYNFRGFDIGNHFCERSIKYGLAEWPHFKMDARKYPNKKQQRLFFTSYLAQYHISTGQPAEVSEEEIAQLTREVNAFALAAHFLWGIWAIIQASTSEIEFGYLEFSKARFDAYYANKNAFLYGIDTAETEDAKSDDEESSFTQQPNHHFEESHFNTPTWCGHCKKFVYQPFGKQGFRCMACNMKVHKHCVDKVQSRCLSLHPSAIWPIVEL